MHQAERHVGGRAGGQTGGGQADARGGSSAHGRGRRHPTRSTVSSENGAPPSPLAALTAQTPDTPGRTEARRRCTERGTGPLPAPPPHPAPRGSTRTSEENRGKKTMKTNSHEEGLRGRGAARSKNQQPSVDGWGARLAGPTVRTSKARLAPGWCPGPPPPLWQQRAVGKRAASVTSGEGGGRSVAAIFAQGRSQPRRWQGKTRPPPWSSAAPPPPRLTGGARSPVRLPELVVSSPKSGAI